MHGEDRLNKILERAKAKKSWVGNSPGRDSIQPFVAQITSAIDQIELALEQHHVD
jgi:hypothetical protein